MINSIGNKGSDEPIRPGAAEESAAAKKSAPAQKGQKDSATAPARGDKVELSAFARDMKAIRSGLGTQDAARASLVETLRNKIEEGTYNVDTKALAQKMYDSGFQGKG